MKPRPYITTLVATLALTATGNAQSYYSSSPYWERARTPRVERSYDREATLDAWEAAAQRRRLIQLQEEANREARKQRVAIEDAANRAHWEGFARDQATAEDRRKARNREAVDGFLDALQESRGR